MKTSPPILNAKFTFDDHIRCMTAKQNLIKGRLRSASNLLSLSPRFIHLFFRARQMKLAKIAGILQIATMIPNSLYQPRILQATTYSQQHQLGTCLNLTIVRKCPARYSCSSFLLDEIRLIFA